MFRSIFINDPRTRLLAHAKRVRSPLRISMVHRRSEVPDTSEGAVIRFAWEFRSRTAPFVYTEPCNSIRKRGRRKYNFVDALTFHRVAVIIETLLPTESMQALFFPSDGLVCVRACVCVCVGWGCRLYCGRGQFYSGGWVIHEAR